MSGATDPTETSIVHIAGLFVESESASRQRCSWCGQRLDDIPVVPGAALTPYQLGALVRVSVRITGFAQGVIGYYRHGKLPLDACVYAHFDAPGME